MSAIDWFSRVRLNSRLSYPQLIWILLPHNHLSFLPHCRNSLCTLNHNLQTPIWNSLIVSKILYEEFIVNVSFTSCIMLSSNLICQPSLLLLSLNLKFFQEHLQLFFHSKFKHCWKSQEELLEMDLNKDLLHFVLFKIRRIKFFQNLN